MKGFLKILLYPLQMILNFLDGERDILYKKPKQK